MPLRFSEKLTFLPVINYKDSYAFADYTQQNWMYSVITYCNPKHAYQDSLLKCQA